MKSAVTVDFGFDVSEAYICDLMENPVEKVELNGRSVTIPVKNYEIVSLKLVK